MCPHHAHLFFSLTIHKDKFEKRKLNIEWRPNTTRIFRNIHQFLYSRTILVTLLRNRRKYNKKSQYELSLRCKFTTPRRKKKNTQVSRFECGRFFLWAAFLLFPIRKIGKIIAFRLDCCGFIGKNVPTGYGRD